MHVAICIVTFRNAGDLVTCLAALELSTFTDFEIVICENGGPEAFQQLLAVTPASLPGGQPVRAVLADGNLGYAAGINRCIGETPGADAWWILNPDTAAEAQALEFMVRRLSSGDCDVVGSTVYTPDGRIDSRAGGWKPWFGRTFSIGYGEPFDAPVDAAAVERTAAYMSGCSMLVSRRFRETVGPMREDFFLYCEEVEWCLRGQDLGFRLGYAADARVLHYKGTTTGSFDDKRQRPRGPVYLDERNKVLLTWIRNPLKLVVVVPFSFVVLCVRFGRRRAWRQWGYALAGWAAGVRNERGKPAWWG